MKRGLIVNADDFGLSLGVNAGVMRGHTDGIVTSASLMVRRDAAAAAADAASSHPGLSLGLHADLGEWAYRAARWEAVYVVTDLDDERAVEAAVAEQLERFRRLTGRDPTHLDSHQHVHDQGAPAACLRRLAERLGVPLRGASAEVASRGDFYGQDSRGTPYPDAITTAALTSLIESLEPGVTELVCHPGDGADADPPYRDERAVELAALCAPEVRAAVQRSGTTLLSFAELGR